MTVSCTNDSQKNLRQKINRLQCVMQSAEKVEKKKKRIKNFLIKQISGKCVRPQLIYIIYNYPCGLTVLKEAFKFSSKVHFIDLFLFLLNFDWRDFFANKNLSGNQKLKPTHQQPLKVALSDWLIRLRFLEKLKIENHKTLLCDKDCRK